MEANKSAEAVENLLKIRELRANNKMGTVEGKNKFSK